MSPPNAGKHSDDDGHELRGKSCPLPEREEIAGVFHHSHRNLKPQAQTREGKLRSDIVADGAGWGKRRVDCGEDQSVPQSGEGAKSELPNVGGLICDVKTTWQLGGCSTATDLFESAAIGRPRSACTGIAMQGREVAIIKRHGVPFPKMRRGGWDEMLTFRSSTALGEAFQGPGRGGNRNAIPPLSGAKFNLPDAWTCNESYQWNT